MVTRSIKNRIENNYRSGFKVIALSTAVVSILIASAIAVSGQNGTIAPGDKLQTVGVPPIPASLAKEVDPYTSIYGLRVAGWDPTKREVWLKSLSSSTWVSRIRTPGATPELTWIYIRSPGIYDIYFQPQGKYLAYTKDTDGDEIFQLYLYEIGGDRKITQLSDGKSRNTEPVWSNAGDRIVYSSTPTGAAGVNLRVVNPLEPQSDRLLSESSGNYFKAYDWSPDDKYVVFCDAVSNTVATVWLVDAKSGEKSLLSPKSTQPEFYESPQFSKDGKGVYVITDHGSDFRRILYIDLASRKLSFIQSDPRWDVEDFQLSPDGRTLAFITNEGGVSRLHLLDVVSKREQAIQQLAAGVVSDLRWNKASTDVAFNFRSAHAANDVYSVNVEAGNVELWAKSVTNGIDINRFAEAEPIHWQSFDKQMLSGSLYRPPPTFSGKRPVIIDIHGGPEEQYRPGFGYDDAYFVNNLGVAKIYPNVRGSSGYGKAFLHSDDGPRREDAVKDIGALLDWIKTQPNLDADRVLVKGASYGGYLSLSVACTYSDRIRAAISDSGISNLAAFVERTEGWRRQLQRSEFGDERDPKIKAFMERTAPVNNARKITKPLLIVQGQNDPRVPVGQAEIIVAATKDRIPVWYILGKNEGHGFAQPENRDYQLYATILFVKEFLLK